MNLNEIDAIALMGIYTCGDSKGVAEAGTLQRCTTTTIDYWKKKGKKRQAKACPGSQYPLGHGSSLETSDCDKGIN